MQRKKQKGIFSKIVPEVFHADSLSTKLCALEIYPAILWIANCPGLLGMCQYKLIAHYNKEQPTWKTTVTHDKHCSIGITHIWASSSRGFGNWLGSWEANGSFVTLSHSRTTLQKIHNEYKGPGSSKIWFSQVSLDGNIKMGRGYTVIETLGHNLLSFRPKLLCNWIQAPYNSWYYVV